MRKLDRREEVIRLKYLEISATNAGILPEEHHDFMLEEMKIANERASAYQIAYEEEKYLRETVEERTLRE